MINSNPVNLYSTLINKKTQYPLSGQIELTYRCNLACIHCYCKGSDDINKELTTNEWKKILNEIHKEGCIYLTFTGGEPLIRSDFLKLYSYAKKKGFIITIFTNGQLFTKEILDYLTKSLPYSIEITLNGITKNTYESITQIKDSFEKVMANIKDIKNRNLPLILKSNCLRQNKNEICKIKKFADKLLGKKFMRYDFQCDPIIYPSFNGNESPNKYRLSFEELLAMSKQDSEILKDYRRKSTADFSVTNLRKDFLYRCTSWLEQFFISPYGRLKFCNFSDRFSCDLKITSFKHGFYKNFPSIINKKFKTNTPCKDCSLRPICYNCPSRAYLETGFEEKPITYYCNLAKAMSKERR
jgi:radical SAM protein with 4Fe4S-binding SPASM domain